LYPVFEASTIIGYLDIDEKSGSTVTGIKSISG